MKDFASVPFDLTFKSGHFDEEGRHNPETKFYNAETPSKKSKIILASAVVGSSIRFNRERKRYVKMSLLSAFGIAAALAFGVSSADAQTTNMHRKHHHQAAVTSMHHRHHHHYHHYHHHHHHHVPMHRQHHKQPAG